MVNFLEMLNDGIGDNMFQEAHDAFENLCHGFFDIIFKNDGPNAKSTVGRIAVVVGFGVVTALAIEILRNNQA